MFFWFQGGRFHNASPCSFDATFEFSFLHQRSKVRICHSGLGGPVFTWLTNHEPQISRPHDSVRRRKPRGLCSTQVVDANQIQAKCTAQVEGAPMRCRRPEWVWPIRDRGANHGLETYVVWEGEAIALNPM